MLCDRVGANGIQAEADFDTKVARILAALLESDVGKPAKVRLAGEDCVGGWIGLESPGIVENAPLSPLKSRLSITYLLDKPAHQTMDFECLAANAFD